MTPRNGVVEAETLVRRRWVRRSAPGSERAIAEPAGLDALAHDALFAPLYQADLPAVSPEDEAIAAYAAVSIHGASSSARRHSHDVALAFAVGRAPCIFHRIMARLPAPNPLLRDLDLPALSLRTHEQFRRVCAASARPTPS
ncbi:MULTISPECIES: hypothetical protein [Sorangium]|uniref:hypothetical protein n=1 Tax=Sorangium TaxID=39643 RepID=UPI0005D25F96|nr:hypothetical protein [Sorangium cellulosum]